MSQTIVKLCVGGKMFVTSRTTLTKTETFFSALLSGKFETTLIDDAHFVDRDGTHFRHVLNYMRDGLVPHHLTAEIRHELTIEAAFYGLDSLVVGLDPTDTMLELVSDITGDTLRSDYENWLHLHNKEQCETLGENLPNAIRLILLHIQTQVKRGCLEGRVALLVSDTMPSTMSFSARGKVDVITAGGFLRELPLKYHDWAGRHDKMDFVAIQKRTWAELCGSAAIDTCMKMFEEPSTSETAAAQVTRILRSRKITGKVARQGWLTITTPIYSQEGVRGDCPVVADFCTAAFLIWSLTSCKDLIGLAVGVGEGSATGTSGSGSSGASGGVGSPVQKTGGVQSVA